MELSIGVYVAVQRLIASASNGTEEARHVASFLLGWASPAEYGTFDLALLDKLDGSDLVDIREVMNSLFDDGFRRPEEMGFGIEIQAIARLHRGEMAWKRLQRSARRRELAGKRKGAMIAILSLLYSRGGLSDDATIHKIASMNIADIQREVHRRLGLGHVSTQEMEQFIQQTYMPLHALTP